MNYTYELYIEDKREDITTRFEGVLNILEKKKDKKFLIKIYDNLLTFNNEIPVLTLENEDQILGWQTKLERQIWMDKEDKIPYNALEETDGFHLVEKPQTHHLVVDQSARDIKILVEKPVDNKIEKAINPKHYKSYFEGDMQWIDAMSRLTRFSDPKIFKAAIELQIRKYLDRCGGKDEELQELQKAMWYMKYLIAYIKNGNRPIFVADIDKILEDKI